MNRFLPISLAVLLASSSAWGDGLTILDNAGKEVPLKKWTWIAGVRRLDWLGKDAPTALAFRELNSTSFVDGVVTLIPLDRLESLAYEPAKQSVTARVAGLDKPLVGSIRFKQSNQVAIEAEVDKGPMGVLAMTFRAGLLKGGVQGVQLAGAKPGQALKGDPIFVTIADDKTPVAEPVYGLRALYRTNDGKELLSSTLHFKVTFKLEIEKIKRIAMNEDAKSRVVECEVTLLDGTEQSMTLLHSVKIDGKDAKLEGFLGEVPAGFKLFPAHCVASLSRDQPKPPEKK